MNINIFDEHIEKYAKNETVELENTMISIDDHSIINRPTSDQEVVQVQNLLKKLIINLEDTVRDGEDLKIDMGECLEEMTPILKENEELYNMFSDSDLGLITASLRKMYTIHKAILTKTEQTRQNKLKEKTKHLNEINLDVKMDAPKLDLFGGFFED